MNKEQSKPLGSTYVFEIEIQQTMQGDVPCVAIVDRTYYVDSIGAEQFLISSYVYGSDRRIDAELDAAGAARGDLLAAAHESGMRAKCIGWNKIVLEDVCKSDSLIASYLLKVGELRHFRFKGGHV